jgi:hypothetical protein
MTVSGLLLRNAERLNVPRQCGASPPVAGERMDNPYCGTAMKHSRDINASSANVGAFVVYVAVVLTLAMALFPPFTSLNGTEYAFVLTGPEWSRIVAASGVDLGLTADIYWAALLVQLAALWAIALGARWFLGRQ